MDNHLKHTQTHLEAITGIYPAQTGSSNTSEEIVKEARNKLIEVFSNCSPEEREAYLMYLRAQSVHQKLYGQSFDNKSSLNHLKGILSINGMPTAGHHINVTLKDLEDAHANLLIEGVLSDNASKK